MSSWRSPWPADAPGVRRVLAANEESAKEQNLMVGIGLQRRHEAEVHRNCVKRLQDGAIGDINLLRVYWNGGGIWYRNKYTEDQQRDGVPDQQLVPLHLDLRRPDLPNSTSTTSTSAAG